MNFNSKNLNSCGNISFKLCFLFAILFINNICFSVSLSNKLEGQPSYFVENKGQIKKSNGNEAEFVSFVYTNKNVSVFLLKEGGIAWQFNNLVGNKRKVPRKGLKHIENDANNKDDSTIMQTFRMDMYLDGANKNSEIVSLGRSHDYINYYNCGVLDVYSYSKIIYKEVYKGIDWIIYLNENGIKYDFVVKPGANVCDIKIKFTGHEKLYIDSIGNLIHGNRLGEFIEEKPISYQEGKNIKTKFKLNSNVLSFEIGKYNQNQTLVIDPNRIWGSYYGGISDDYGQECVTDQFGNVYLCGQTSSFANIASLGFQNSFAGAYDAFLTKFNSNGIRQWATYYGGSGTDWSNSCSVDNLGSIFLFGLTSSTTNISSSGFQNSYGGGNDVFLVKFNSSGVRQWATYYGGSVIDFPYSCSTDPSGNIYICGYTSSNTGIASGGFQNTIGGGTDAFLVKFNTTGSRLWATYYGGPGADYGCSCRSDNLGNIFLAGGTASTNNIASQGYQNIIGGGMDAFLVKFSSTGLRQWGTYYGYSGSDYGYSCSVDQSNNVYLCGSTGTTSTNPGTLIATPGSHQPTFGGIQDAFLTKFNASGIRLWATYYGGNGSDDGQSCFADQAGNVYLCGSTGTTSINPGTVIATAGSHQSSFGGDNDAFLVIFNTSGIRQWATYYGGSGYDKGISCVTDQANNIYLCGYTGTTTVNPGTVIATPGSFQPSFGGLWDSFIVKFGQGIGSGVVSTNNNSPICQGKNLVFTAGSISGASYSWSGPNGFTSNFQNPIIVGATTLASGIYSVTATTSSVIYTGTTNVSILPAVSSTFNVSSLGPYIFNNITYTVSGTYTQIFTNIEGCDSIVTLNLNYIPIGITELTEVNKRLIIFPNPSEGIFNLKFINDLEINEIEIYDYSMKYLISIPYNRSVVDLSEYSDGFYFMKIIVGGKLFWFKLVKLRDD